MDPAPLHPLVQVPRSGNCDLSVGRRLGLGVLFLRLRAAFIFLGEKLLVAQGVNQLGKQTGIYLADPPQTRMQVGNLKWWASRLQSITSAKIS